MLAMTLRAAELLRRWAPGLLLGLAALGLLLAGPAACQRGQRIAAEQRVERTQRDAAGGSARDAVETAAAASVRERAADELTQRNQREIRHADGAAQNVDPAATRAGFDGLCRRTAYRDSQRCRLRQPAAD
ncbi:hypothetical protein [Sphingomonas mesophila]|uniref:hypothetical protein n=1 Tax=Sphingomonas mesophila TaxID=2303576 RepID=UPI0013C2F3F8|nr:hypothetical protein [Sphingomonas mesophila]